jgi:hypothetical protein
MCKTSQHQTSRRHPLAAGTALVACLGALATACGGGNNEPGEPRPVAAYRLSADVTPTDRWVQLEGCVVDEFYIPRTGTPVHALAADGRLVGGAASDMDGVFRVQVPARQSVSVRIDKPGGESLTVVTGRTNLSVGACLRDPQA